MTAITLPIPMNEEAISVVAESGEIPQGISTQPIYKQLTLKDIIDSRNAFINAAKSSTDRFNAYDQTTAFWFRLVFYFDNTNEYNIENCNGLLSNAIPGTTEITEAAKKLNIPYTTIQNGNKWWSANSALGFLLNNNEYERAVYLSSFISLLSKINSFSPWYWASVSGLDQALKSEEFTKDAKLPEERKRIEISTYAEPYDTRIGTLLSLYKAACWSKELHKEIVPANLRRFDMGIYVFADPVSTLVNGNPDDVYIGGDTSKTNTYNTGWKYFELHNCEIDYDAESSGFAELNNLEGTGIAYKIPITFTTIREMRYNEFTTQCIGKVLDWDINNSLDRDSYLELALDAINNHPTEADKYLNGRLKGHILTNLVGQAANLVLEPARQFVTRNVLGNLGGVQPLDSTLNIANNLTTGNAIGLAQNVAAIVRNSKTEEVKKLRSWNLRNTGRNARGNSPA